MDGIKQALSTKEKRKKKGKALDLQQRQEYHGRAVFWSPRKIREARVRQSVREQEEKEQQLQKAETAELRKAAKLYKEKIAEEKRIAREAAKYASRYPAAPEFINNKPHDHFDQNSNRRVINACSLAFVKQGTAPLTEAHFQAMKKPFSGKKIKRFAYFTAFHLVHEMMHATQPVTLIDKGNGKLQPDMTAPAIIDIRMPDQQAAYRWDSVRSLTREQALRNAQSYAFFVLGCWLADSGHVLKRSSANEALEPTDECYDPEDAEEEEADNGVLWLYDDVKRSV
ncbi:hypothetical protein BDV95DRAFT_615764 [Massariosphaeria phaeospora]|uniref:Uncharacterized protein n=1 Tax=Massariosphaeria phaeospora TaxID=100035 RepID=A0A7C8IC42_9PLEO|nr:hypothetical protein BDV95DRAFT_615764 [Massariosphaeria phaeospora]